jgi:hypothetical protein
MGVGKSFNKQAVEVYAFKLHKHKLQKIYTFTV